MAATSHVDGRLCYASDSSPPSWPHPRPLQMPLLPHPAPPLLLRPNLNPSSSRYADTRGQEWTSNLHWGLVIIPRNFSILLTHRPLIHVDYHSHPHDESQPGVIYFSFFPRLHSPLPGAPPQRESKKKIKVMSSVTGN